MENAIFLFLDILNRAFSLTWWIILPLILFAIFWKLWLVFIRLRFIKKIKWSFFEIKIPKEILKTPKTMEQIFAQIYGGIYSFGKKWLEIYWDGEIEEWISFEIFGRAKSIHFYVYFPEKYKQLIRSAIYSQYPDAEISEAQDYVGDLPLVLPNEEYDIWGTEFTLTKDAPYPIKTYPFFEDPQEEKRIDPLAPIFEAMSQLKADEIMMFQFLIYPTGDQIGDDWKKEGEKIIKEIAEKAKTKKEKNAVAEFLRNLAAAPVQPPVWGEESESKDTFPKFLRPDEQEIIKAITNKISKPGFRTNIRFLYIDSKDSFTNSNVSAATSAFNQFTIQNLNSFKLKNKTSVSKSFLMRIFPNWRARKILIKKRRFYDAFCERRLLINLYDFNFKELSLLNTEELATVYHFPISIPGGEAPTLRRIEAKTGGPPPELPVE